ncbi:MAG: NUDIX domain-containing protein [archaeon]|nr:NUDIX domain-containing protein [archaeon]
MNKVINAAVIKEGKILLVKKNTSWILPGGKPLARESDEDCLEREVCEELSGTRIDRESLRFYEMFEGISPNRKRKMRVDVYSADIIEKVNGPSGEISDFGWFDFLETRKIGSEITAKILQSLHRDRYL